MPSHATREMLTAEELPQCGGSGAQPASLPLDEPERLRALYLSGLLDTTASPVFAQLTDAVAAIFRVPTVLISLVDKDRQYFYCVVGFDIRQTHRDESFCAHALQATDPFVVLDTRRDQRFCSNPLVAGEPHLRFYAGAPIYSAGGQCLGTLCILDSKPRRSFGRSRQRLLTSLANIASLLIAADVHKQPQREHTVCDTPATSQEAEAPAAARPEKLSKNHSPSSL